MYRTTGTNIRDLDLTVRRAGEGDTVALLQLAALDSALPLQGPVLVAELDGRMVAAVPLEGGSPIADPFVRTADIVALVELRTEQVRRCASTRPGVARGLVAALRGAVAR